MKRTKYTCPTLMGVAKWLYKIRLWRTHDVFWKVPSEEGYGAFVVAHQKGKQHGYELSCPFPEWAIFTEMRIRRFFLVTYAWIRYPREMLKGRRRSRK